MKELLLKIDKLKKQIDSLRPLKKIEIIQLKQYYKIGLTYSSNAIEGNTLTENETKIIIENGLTIGGKPLKEHLEVCGHSEAFDYMYEIIDKKNITEDDILKIHYLFYYRIDRENAGRYRNVSVFISGTKHKFPQPTEVPKLMREFTENLIKLKNNTHPVILAALAHKNFVEIHPFVDGNGRTARLIMNLLLIKNGFPITIIPPIKRIDYINALQKANSGNDKPFLFFIAQMVYEAEKEYIRLIKN